MKETVQERTVLKEKVAETFINSKNTMAVLDTDELERHTGGTNTAVTAERNEFEVPAVRTTVQGTAERGITTA